MMCAWVSVATVPINLRITGLSDCIPVWRRYICRWLPFLPLPEVDAKRLWDIVVVPTMAKGLWHQQWWFQEERRFSNEHSWLTCFCFSWCLFDWSPDVAIEEIKRSWNDPCCKKLLFFVWLNLLWLKMIDIPKMGILWETSNLQVFLVLIWISLLLWSAILA